MLHATARDQRPLTVARTLPALPSVLTASWRAVAKPQNRTIRALLLRADLLAVGSGRYPSDHQVRRSRQRPDDLLHECAAAGT
jgi:hypothetical protein